LSVKPCKTSRKSSRKSSRKVSRKSSRKSTNSSPKEIDKPNPIGNKVIYVNPLNSLDDDLKNGNIICNDDVYDGR
jgi:hypothetical protein